MHVKGYAAPETKAAAERARLLIEQAEALGEPPEDPLLLFSVLYGSGSRSLVAFNGDVMLRSCGTFLRAGREARGDGSAHDRASPHGHRLLYTGDFAEAREHFDQAIALYDPAEHRPLATRFGQDVGWQSCPIGRGPNGCLAIPRPRSQTPSKRSRMRARSAKLHIDVCAVGHLDPHLYCGDYSAAEAASRRTCRVGRRKRHLVWKAFGMMQSRLPAGPDGQSLGCGP